MPADKSQLKSGQLPHQKQTLFEPIWSPPQWGDMEQDGVVARLGSQPGERRRSDRTLPQMTGTTSFRGLHVNLKKPFDCPFDRRPLSTDE